MTRVHSPPRSKSSAKVSRRPSCVSTNTSGNVLLTAATVRMPALGSLSHAKSRTGSHTSVHAVGR